MALSTPNALINETLLIEKSLIFWSILRQNNALHNHLNILFNFRFRGLKEDMIVGFWSMFFYLKDFSNLLKNFPSIRNIHVFKGKVVDLNPEWRFIELYLMIGNVWEPDFRTQMLVHDEPNSFW